MFRPGVDATDGHTDVAQLLYLDLPDLHLLMHVSADPKLHHQLQDYLKQPLKFYASDSGSKRQQGQTRYRPSYQQAAIDTDLLTNDTTPIITIKRPEIKKIQVPACSWMQDGIRIRPHCEHCTKTRSSASGRNPYVFISSVLNRCRFGGGASDGVVRRAVLGGLPSPSEDQVAILHGFDFSRRVISLPVSA